MTELTIEGRTREEVQVRVLARIAVSDSGCWEWTATMHRRGYGQLSIKAGRHVQAHRASYLAFFGEIPDDLELDHLCVNKKCVNPWHLEPVTHAENVRRHFAARTHCKNGHAYSDENTALSANGRRRCRVCYRELRRKASEPCPAGGAE